jgi:hypothetical protein
VTCRGGRIIGTRRCSCSAAAEVAGWDSRSRCCSKSPIARALVLSQKAGSLRYSRAPRRLRTAQKRRCVASACARARTQRERSAHTRAHAPAARNKLARCGAASSAQPHCLHRAAAPRHAGGWRRRRPIRRWCAPVCCTRHTVRKRGHAATRFAAARLLRGERANACRSSAAARSRRVRTACAARGARC